MFRADFYYCTSGLREEQLDRFVAIETGCCTIFMLADGYASRTERPHYVDWLTEQLSLFKDSGLDCESISNEITRLLKQTECYPGKASVAFVVSDKEQYIFTTLGDTRIYWPAENLRTEDHSIAQLAVQQGSCSSEQLRFHPYRNKLMQHAGAGVKHQPDWQSRPIYENECLILCSDGFWSLLNDRDIYSAVDNTILHFFLTRMMVTPPSDNLSVVMLRSTPLA